MCNRQQDAFEQAGQFSSHLLPEAIRKRVTFAPAAVRMKTPQPAARFANGRRAGRARRLPYQHFQEGHFVKHLKKAAAAVLAAAIAFSLAACRSAVQAPAPSPAAQQQEFDDFLMQDFISTMESEYTALHVYLQNPAAFGVDMSKVRPGLGSRPDIVSQRQALQAAEEAYGQFLSFDRSKLTAEQQDTYDIY